MSKKRNVNVGKSQRSNPPISAATDYFTIGNKHGSNDKDNLTEPERGSCFVEKKLKAISDCYLLTKFTIATVN